MADKVADSGDIDIYEGELKRLWNELIETWDEVYNLKNVKHKLEKMLKDAYDPGKGDMMLLQKKIEHMEA